MGSLNGSGNGQDNNNASIYDLSIREIEACMRKLEADNVNLRRELYESRVKLNEKDEEILKLGRELLSHKTETLVVTRRIVSLAEDFKKGQVDGLHNFLMNVFKSNGVEPQQTRSSVQRSSKPGPPASSFVPHRQLAIAGPKSVEPPKTFNATESACLEDDDEQHVKSPFGYQYRHLRVQLHVDVDTTSPEEDMDDDEEEYYPFDKNEEVEEKPGYNTYKYDRVN